MVLGLAEARLHHDDGERPDGPCDGPGPGVPGRELAQHRRVLPVGDPVRASAVDPVRRPGLPRSLQFGGCVRQAVQSVSQSVQSTVAEPSAKAELLLVRSREAVHAGADGVAARPIRPTRGPASPRPGWLRARGPASPRSGWQRPRGPASPRPGALGGDYWISEELKTASRRSVATCFRPAFGGYPYGKRKPMQYQMRPDPVPSSPSSRSRSSAD